MTMTELTPGESVVGSALASGGVTQSASDLACEVNQGESRLVFDPAMAGLTLDEVSVVAVADRPVLVPLSRALAEQSGFTVLQVDDDALLALGIAPRRVAPVAAPEPEVVAAHVAAQETIVDPPAETEAPRPVAEASPVASVFSRAMTEVPVETARPINTMAASHRDWEPESLSWPYVDRRLDEPSAATDALATVPRSLTSGRPVNLVEAAELLIEVRDEPARSTMVDLESASVPAIRPTTMRIHSGSFVVLTGDRGSGKTSLLRLLAGFDVPSSGRAVVDSIDVSTLDADHRAMSEAVSSGFIPQQPFLVPDLTVAENVELPLLASGVTGPLARGAAEDALRRVGLGAQIGLPSGVLSGAEVRLAVVARAFVSNPELIVADEPVTGLCDADAALVIDRLVEHVAQGGTVVMACTDPRVRLLGPRHIVLDRGAIVRDDPQATTLA